MIPGHLMNGADQIVPMDCSEEPESNGLPKFNKDPHSLEGQQVGQQEEQQKKLEAAPAEKRGQKRKFSDPDGFVWTVSRQSKAAQEDQDKRVKERLERERLGLRPVCGTLGIKSKKRKIELNDDIEKEVEAAYNKLAEDEKLNKPIEVDKVDELDPRDELDEPDEPIEFDDFVEFDERDNFETTEEADVLDISPKVIKESDASSSKEIKIIKEDDASNKDQKILDEGTDKDQKNLDEGTENLNNFLNLPHIKEYLEKIPGLIDKKRTLEKLWDKLNNQLLYFKKFKELKMKGTIQTSFPLKDSLSLSPSSSSLGVSSSSSSTSSSSTPIPMDLSGDDEPSAMTIGIKSPVTDEPTLETITLEELNEAIKRHEETLQFLSMTIDDFVQKAKMTFQEFCHFRPHQILALRDYVQKGRMQGKRDGVVVHCTGSGKTFFTSHIALIAKEPAIILVPTIELSIETEAAIKEYLKLELYKDGIEEHRTVKVISLSKETEKARTIKSIQKILDEYDIVIMTHQCLDLMIDGSHGKRVKKYTLLSFKRQALAIFDEAQYGLTSGKGDLFDYFRAQGLRLLLVSATPSRISGSNGVKTAYERVELKPDGSDNFMQEYPISDGIIDGTLASADTVLVFPENAEKFKFRKNKAGEFIEADLERDINTPQNNKMIVEMYFKLCHFGCQAFIYPAGIEHAKCIKAEFDTINIDEIDPHKILRDRYAKNVVQEKIEAMRIEGKILSEAKVKIIYDNAFKDFSIAEVVSSSDDHKKQNRKNFNKYKNQGCLILTGPKMLDEGINFPNTEAIILVVPNGTWKVLAQRFGRGTRFAPNKDHLTVIDTVWGKPEDSQRAFSVLSKDEVTFSSSTRVIEKNRQQSKRVQYLPIKVSGARSFKTQDRLPEEQAKIILDKRKKADARKIKMPLPGSRDLVYSKKNKTVNQISIKDCLEKLKSFMIMVDKQIDCLSNLFRGGLPPITILSSPLNQFPLDEATEINFMEVEPSHSKENTLAMKPELVKEFETLTMEAQTKLDHVKNVYINKVKEHSISILGRTTFHNKMDTDEDEISKLLEVQITRYHSVIKILNEALHRAVIDPKIFAGNEDKLKKEQQEAFKKLEKEPEVMNALNDLKSIQNEVNDIIQDYFEEKSVQEKKVTFENKKIRKPNHIPKLNQQTKDAILKAFADNPAQFDFTLVKQPFAPEIYTEHVIQSLDQKIIVNILNTISTQHQNYILNVIIKKLGYEYLQYQLIEKYLDLGVDPSLKDNEGKNALHHICRISSSIFHIVNQSISIFIKLCCHPKLKFLINEQDNEGNTPLHYAYKSHIKQFTSFLLTMGAKIDIPNKQGLKLNQVFYLDLFQDKNVNAKDIFDSKNETFLHYIAQTFCLKWVLSYCINELGMDYRVQNLNGDNIAHLFLRSQTIVDNVKSFSNQFTREQKKDLYFAKNEKNRAPLQDACCLNIYKPPKLGYIACLFQEYVNIDSKAFYDLMHEVYLNDFKMTTILEQIFHSNFFNACFGYGQLTFENLFQNLNTILDVCIKVNKQFSFNQKPIEQISPKLIAVLEKFYQVDISGIQEIIQARLKKFLKKFAEIHNKIIPFLPQEKVELFVALYDTLHEKFSRIQMDLSKKEGNEEEHKAQSENEIEATLQPIVSEQPDSAPLIGFNREQKKKEPIVNLDWELEKQILRQHQLINVDQQGVENLGMVSSFLVPSGIGLQLDPKSRTLEQRQVYDQQKLFTNQRDGLQLPPAIVLQAQQKAWALQEEERKRKAEEEERKHKAEEEERTRKAEEEERNRKADEDKRHAELVKTMEQMYKEQEELIANRNKIQNGNGESPWPELMASPRLLLCFPRTLPSLSLLSDDELDEDDESEKTKKDGVQDMDLSDDRKAMNFIDLT